MQSAVVSSSKNYYLGESAFDRILNFLVAVVTSSTKVEYTVWNYIYTSAQPDDNSVTKSRGKSIQFITAAIKL